NVPSRMRLGIAIFAALAAALATALAVSIVDGGGKTSSSQAAMPGEPSVAIVSPRNGARQTDHAVVVKVRVDNFSLAPGSFGTEPQLGEGHIRFALNRVPDCVDPVKLKRAEESPVGRGRLVGASFDFARYSGPNGVLAERIGSSGSYSPATRPEIYYHELPAGFYRLVVTLARNNGATTPYHAVTNFQILPRPGHGPKCSGGKVSSAKAAAFD
ncbi:MAG TPA: hypothetical protein VFM94_00695, partial [Solirubrobacterales bacterium]|nr:hypothetical protein [Solirubrobacterales bacterium]